MEKRFVKRLLILFLLIVATLFNNYFGQNPKRKKNVDNVVQYSLVYFSRAVSKDSIKVTAFLEIPFKSLQFIKRKDGFHASYDASIMLQDKDGKQIIRNMWSDSISTKNYMHTQSKFRSRKHYTNLIIAKDKYIILSDLYDKDTRNKGSKKKKLDYKKQKKTPSLMEPIIIAELKGEWGFESNKFPITGKKITSIDKGLTVLLSGFVDDSPYSLQVFIKGVDDKKELFVINENTNDGFFNHEVLIDKEYLNSINLNIEVQLVQSKKEKKIEKNITIYKPGLSGFVNNVERSFRQMKYILTNTERNNAKGKKGKDLENIFLEYWKLRDPTPETSLNELMEEYYIRVNYVNDHYNMSWKEGWETDFGMIYILFGPPDQIQRANMNSSNTSVYQVWYYNRINKEFVFKDLNGFGDYRLDRPFLGSNY
ncbi:MAG: hypothetical protein CBD44_01885 [Flavobacteriaceae bacterium TMED184]|nr:MAG: hypothetical protein CBD44_01885 [Flavobacteriaceae bacterium TMED184]|tara:strand:- start:3485 stop:4756 length:1272 start_codon:yes stop_codon:yes gene_type:complete